MGFEPMIRVLQTLALPLGHVAVPFCCKRVQIIAWFSLWVKKLWRWMDVWLTTFGIGDMISRVYRSFAGGSGGTALRQEGCPGGRLLLFVRLDRSCLMPLGDGMPG